jgi:tellurite resistance protein TerC
VVVVWIAFLVFIFILLALDLGVFHRKAHVVSVREALTWSCIWVALALAFSGFVYVAYDHQWFGLGLTPDPVDRSAAFPDGRLNDGWSAFLKFITGYVVEESLSVDNVFVIAMLFQYFAVPRQYQHRVLFWGILGAVAMRGLMIAIGAQLVTQFAWILYVFGGILIVTAIRMWFFTAEDVDPGQNFIVRRVKRMFPVTDEYHGEQFFVRGAAGWMLTPLALALVMVETTDLIFAVDSIPAIFAITADPFLVFTSNVFAILGLRSLYFALAGALHALRYMQHALAAVLVTVGVKMLAHKPLEALLGEHFNLYLLLVVLSILAVGVVASLLHRTGNATSQTSSPGAADLKSAK